jgi:DNA-binding Lrp family transcriptional regulator
VGTETSQSLKTAPEKASYLFPRLFQNEKLFEKTAILRVELPLMASQRNPLLPARDRRILLALQEDSRITLQDLAEQVGMSTSACWRRVKALEEAGVIERYTVIVNTRKAGFGLSAMVHVSLARHEQENVDTFVREVRRHPEVLECFATSGEADFHMRVVVADIDAYNDFLDSFIFKVPGVSQVRSNIVLKEIKTDTALPLSASD